MKCWVASTFHKTMMLNIGVIVTCVASIPTHWEWVHQIEIWQQESQKNSGKSAMVLCDYSTAMY